MFLNATILLLVLRGAASRVESNLPEDAVTFAADGPVAARAWDVSLRSTNGHGAGRWYLNAVVALGSREVLILTCLLLRRATAYTEALQLHTAAACERIDWQDCLEGLGKFDPIFLPSPLAKQLGSVAGVPSSYASSGSAGQIQTLSSIIIIV